MNAHLSYCANSPTWLLLCCWANLGLLAKIKWNTRNFFSYSIKNMFFYRNGNVKLKKKTCQTYLSNTLKLLVVEGSVTSESLVTCAGWIDDPQ